MSSITPSSQPQPPHLTAWREPASGRSGLGVGAIIGSALTPREVYVTPPPPPRAYYGAASYGGPEPWTPGWYRYCRALHGPYFDANSGYYQGGDGGVYFCR